jgi:hypothetical protein
MAMAFNPFHRFRKHQRVILAVVTIMLMLVFGLTWGMGDITQRLGGAPRDSGDLVTTFKFSSSVFSTETKVWQVDVDRQNRLRSASNDFILNVVGKGTSDAMDKMAPPQNMFAPPDPKKMKYPVQLTEFISRREERVRPNPWMARFKPPPPPHERITEIERDMQRLATLRQNPLPFGDKDKDAGKADDLVKACDTLLASLQFELWVTEQEREKLEKAEKNETFVPNLYFGGKRSLDDALDFMLWKHQADRLGITYTETDVRKAINRLVGTGEPIALTGNLLDNTLVADYFKGRNRTVTNISDRDVKELMDALADEFRVQTAQQVLLGHPSSSAGAFFVTTGIYQPPVSVTPDEFLEYVRNKRTTLKVAFLTVPVKNFVKPDESVADDKLRELYDRFRSAEPAPDRAQPAFKVPRRVRVEYVTGDPESPYFKEAARNLIAHPTVLRVACFASSYPVGGGVLGWLGTTGVPLLEEPLLQEYERYQLDEDFEVIRHHAVSPAVFDRSYSATATVGDILGSLQQAGPLWVPTSLASASAAYDTATANAAGGAVHLWTEPNVLSVAAAYPTIHTVQPLKQVETMLLTKREKSLGERQVGQSLETLSKDLEKISSTADKETMKDYLVKTYFLAPAVSAVLSDKDRVRNYLEKTTRDLGLKINGMTEAKDRYGLADDPALKHFKDEYTKIKSETPNERLLEFPDIFLRVRGTYHPRPWATTAPQAEYRFWLAEDKPAHEQPFEEIKPQVLAAYQIIVARSNALRYVQDLTGKELKGREWDTDSVKREEKVKLFLEQQKKGRVFELDKIARLITPETLPNFGSERPYYAYLPPEADIPYPPANFVERAMALRNPGDVVFLLDRPEKNFYVGVLLDRAVPTIDDFRKVYEDADRFLSRDPLWDLFMRERRQDFQKQFVQRLREEATGDLDNGKIKIAPDVRAKYSNSESQ